MARKTVYVSDLSNKQIPEGSGAKVRVAFADARRGVFELDLTDREGAGVGGQGPQGRSPGQEAEGRYIGPEVAGWP